MATRLKTILFALPTYTSIVPDETTTTIGSGSIYIPENSVSTPITIKSCFVEIGWQDVCTVGGTINEHRVSLTLGAADVSTITETDDIANSGENMGGVIGPFDFTTYAIANIGTGTSIEYQVDVYFDQSTGTDLGMNNVSAILYLTYEYDDTVTTQIKTVRIPFESKTTALATSEEEIGTNQIPLLDDFLPEDSVVIRDYFFILEGNQNNTGATDITVSLQIDSEAQHDKGTEERALASEIFTRYVWSRTLDYPSTSSAHAFKAWANIAAYNSVTITLVITYEFDQSATTSVLNSIIIPMEMGSPMGFSEIPSKFERTIMLQETNVVLKQSAVRLNLNAMAPIAGLTIKSGTQTYTAYTHNVNVTCGMYSLQQRIDAGSAYGSAFSSFGRGRNSLTFECYRTDTADDPTNLNGYFIINYTSDKHEDGVGSHSHTVLWNLFQWDALLSDRLLTTFQYDIPEENYWFNSIGVISLIWDTISANAFTMDVEVKSDEGKGGGYIDLYADAIQSNAERRCSIVYMRGRDAFKRFPEDIDTERIDAQILRTYRFFTPATSAQGIEALLTYHSITYPISGSCTNYSGDGAGIDVYFYNTYDNVPRFKLTTAIGGTFSGLWYDNTEHIYAVAREDNNHVGRSANGLAGT